MKKAITGEYIQDDFVYIKLVASKTKFISSMYDIGSKIMKLSKGMTTIKFRIVCSGGEGKERGWVGALFKLYIYNTDSFYLG